MTLKEIAQAMNVSLSTVSLVLNQKEGVSANTRNRVLKMLKENGYTVSPQRTVTAAKKSIRFLKYTKHSLLVDGNEGFVSSIIDSAEREARKRGYNFVITSFREDMLDEVFHMVYENPLDGIILLGTEFEPKHFHYLDGINVPFIVVDNHLKYYAADSVVMNNEDIVYMALEHLASLGHEKIGYLHSNIETGNFEERSCAFSKALGRLGIEFDEKYVYNVGVTMQNAYESMQAVIKPGTEFPTALFADNDTIAIGSIKALKGSGYNIPDDISIIGFDDIPFSLMTDPQLTTMKVPTDDIGIWAVRRLNYRISHPNAPVMKMQFGANLVIRESTKPFKK